MGCPAKFCTAYVQAVLRSLGHSVSQRLSSPEPVHFHIFERTAPDNQLPSSSASCIWEIYVLACMKNAARSYPFAGALRWVAHTGAPGHRWPAAYGKGPAVYRRRADGCGQGVWPRRMVYRQIDPDGSPCGGTVRPCALPKEAAAPGLVAAGSDAARSCPIADRICDVNACRAGRAPSPAPRNRASAGFHAGSAWPPVMPHTRIVAWVFCTGRRFGSG